MKNSEKCIFEEFGYASFLMCYSTFSLGEVFSQTKYYIIDLDAYLIGNLFALYPCMTILLISIFTTETQSTQRFIHLV
ncbi:hypothetical protein GCM10010832_15330 [Psychroflexus planctonicus]|uniref:Uncharacterized protein n=1 Tax=Psychroflexus planctonicus TaxID=1526575 RepID=A0ABQ1SHG2_9FLAO|nr:hypothetical protein GCM10010832_15330 [Psychroflexus planctonicus]